MFSDSEHSKSHNRQLNLQEIIFVIFLTAVFDFKGSQKNKAPSFRGGSKAKSGNPN